MAEQMRDAYETLFTSGLDVEDAFIGARAFMIVAGGRARDPSVSIEAWPVVYKTWMLKEAADQVDWENKESVDFDEVWEVLIVHRKYR